MATKRCDEDRRDDSRVRMFHLMMHIGHLLEEWCRSRLSEVGLGHGQARVLMTLGAHGAVNQADLARGMDIAPPTLSLMLKKLLDQKLVQRMAVKGDSRVYSISLTPAGEKAVRLIEKVWSDAGKTIIESLGDANLPEMHDRLLQVRNGLGGRGPGLGPGPRKPKGR